VDLKDIGWEGVDWIDVTPVRDKWHVLLNMVMNHFKEPKKPLPTLSVT
jgi:hypothetical protein